MCIAMYGNPSHNYGVSLAVWDHTVLPSTRHKRTHPAFTPARQSIYRPFKDGGLSKPRVSPVPACCREISRTSPSEGMDKKVRPSFFYVYSVPKG